MQACETSGLKMQQANTGVHLRLVAPLSAGELFDPDIEGDVGTKIQGAALPPRLQHRKRQLQGRGRSWLGQVLTAKMWGR